MKGKMKLLTGVCDMPSYGCYKDLLFSFAAVDDDFNGKNGPEYLWPEAKKTGFKSNAEYAWAIAKKKGDAIPDDDVIFKKFVDMWMGSNLYYEQYELSIMHEENGDIFAVALAYVEAV